MCSLSFGERVIFSTSGTAARHEGPKWQYGMQRPGREGLGARGFPSAGPQAPGARAPARRQAPRQSPTPSSPRSEQDGAEEPGVEAAGPASWGPCELTVLRRGLALPLCAAAPPSVNRAAAHAALCLGVFQGLVRAQRRPLLATVRKIRGQVFG